MVDAGEIVDSMTIIAMLQAERRRAGRWPGGNRQGQQL
jgi:hypothetical protein